MPAFHVDHLIINGRTNSYPYTSKVQGRSIEIRKGLNRVRHGRSIRDQFNQAVRDFQQNSDDNFVYIVFKSPPDFLLDLQKFEDSKGHFRLKTTRQLESEDHEGQLHTYYEAAVYLNRQAISKFLQKVDDYVNRNHPRWGSPLNQSLVANIDEIRAATLQSFWQEPEILFPEFDQRQWWEIWISRENADDPDNPISRIAESLAANEVQIGRRFLAFPEHYVYLMNATAEQLSKSILYTDRLCEIRMLKENAAFFTYYTPPEEQHVWADDLATRVNFAPDDVSVCLLDSGITLNNPLLANVVDPRHVVAIEAHWDAEDKFLNNGHGTPMAGLAIYGDLTDLFATQHRIDIRHKLESIKIYNGNGFAPELRGAVTIEAIARAEILNPNHNRIVCLALTNWDVVHKGRPSSHSAAIDQLLFGTPDVPNDNLLFMISAGNLDHHERLTYPLSNEKNSIEDPAQSYNAIVVGAYTLKDQLDIQRFPGANLLAQRGALSPSSRTSADWDNEWCRKPDIVMEGGNHGIDSAGLVLDWSLELLSTSTARFLHAPLVTFGDTSGATALASRFGAQLYREYPNLRPETIRGLMIHSAEWTPAMRRNRSIQQLNAGEKLRLFRQVGYGVPNMGKARYSANNSLSLIAERILKPYKLEGSVTKTDQFHLFELPWPVDALQGLFNTEVKLTVTLSYFIEPNPGNKRYEQASSYMSHGLRFKMIDSGERPAAFLGRISKAMEEDNWEAEGAEDWILGERLRNKGCIHKDIWVGPAVELANRNQIAIYPVGGWWRARKQLERYNSHVYYSLIITIEAPDNIANLDIYTPVAELIRVPIDI
ncbi:Subtilase family protein [Chitinophaga sp. CF118]|uniref:S8 family peptidase n=1 Tax=Chitinophaga sp. CF118 TaxID=1884367 RepID=UPI0008E6FC23|nr:S8 family peptidase [Chitinophaga sp. CF118]SFE91534.1 Subtilase family protein [Chitinophaga sp. CF118]